jgi:hypothetical protein
MSLTFGSTKADSLPGTDEADLILGLDGADTIEGLGGDVDTLLGGAGNDAIYGGRQGGLGKDGRDVILGGPGDDLLEGGEDGSANTLLGGSGSDRIWAGWGPDTVSGGDGADTIDGSGVGHFLSFRAWPDSLYSEAADILQGGDGDDIANGHGGSDTILGGAGDDTLTGGFGANWKSGGSGADLVTGGAGADHFRISPVTQPMGDPLPDTGVGEGNRLTITDFEQDRDRLDFSGYDDQSLLYGGVPPPPAWPEPVFLGSRGFIATFALQVRTEILANVHTLVQFVAPGRHPSDAEPTVPEAPTGEVELTRAIHLAAEDLILDHGPSLASISAEMMAGEENATRPLGALAGVDPFG